MLRNCKFLPAENLKDIWLEPQDARPLTDVIRAIEEADLIVMGPGSLLPVYYRTCFCRKLPRKFRNRLFPEFTLPILCLSQEKQME